jgi:hypothetical protein
MFNNKKNRISEFNKTFLKALQTLENPNLNISAIEKILQIIDISLSDFHQKFEDWQR